MKDEKTKYAPDDFWGESLRYTENGGDKMYYVQIINPTDRQLFDMGYLRGNRANGVLAPVGV